VRPIRSCDVPGDAVGFDATRRYRDDKRNDIVLLVVALVIIGGAVLWGFGVL
jgi:hypothetical protein